MAFLSLRLSGGANHGAEAFHVVHFWQWCIAELINAILAAVDNRSRTCKVILIDNLLLWLLDW